jgi:hypothetical protein
MIALQPELARKRRYINDKLCMREREREREREPKKV